MMSGQLLSQVGNLKNYWHVIGLATEVKRKCSLKRALYGHRFLIWRDGDDLLHALTDCCAHKQAPLEVADFQSSQIVCPYHGWKYDASGKLQSVPSSPSAANKLNCKVDDFPICERYGFVWIYFGDVEADGTPKNEIPNIEPYVGSKWSKRLLKKEFESTEDLLIDNFMDPTHTGLVHDGIIRSGESTSEHDVTVTANRDGVLVDFKEQVEKIGWGMQLLFGSEMKVKHTDEFLFPNLVRVVYKINGSERFVALIACSPTEKLNGGKTLVFVQVRYRFGWITPFLWPFVRVLTDKVLQQDFEITQKQFANRQRFENVKENLVAADLVASQVKKLRRKMVAGETISESEQSIKLRF